MKNLNANRRGTHEQELRFLRTELQTSLTLARLARTAHSPEKRKRNVGHSRRAYDALVHFRHKAQLTQEETKEIDAGMAKLKQVLQKLGEKL